MNATVHWLEADRRFEVQPGETVLAAALRQEVPLPHECQFGGCGSCRVRLLQGEVRYEEWPFALSEEEAAQGQAIACQALPKTAELVLSVRPPVVYAEPAERKVNVAAVDWLHPDIARVRLALQDGQTLNFRPGQYVNVKLAEGRHRSFSLASRSGETMLELHVRRIPGGLFTDGVLGHLQPGDELTLKVPLGSFQYRAEDDRPLVLVATGTGMAPLRSIVLSLLDDPNPPPVSLYWGMRHASELYLDEEIRRWAEALDDFRYVPVLSRADRAWTGMRGHVQDAVLADHPDLAEQAIYLCGSPAMIAEARSRFAAAGASLPHLYTDSFVFQEH